MHILYCQKMIFPNSQAHAIHTGMTAANFAAAGAPTMLFPGVPLLGGKACLEDFFARLGYAPIPEHLHLAAIPCRHKGLYGLFFRYRLWQAMRRPCLGGLPLCWASSVKEAHMALSLRALAGKEGRMPVVFEVHHLISRLKQGREADKAYALEREAFSKADMIVFNCEDLQEKARGYLPAPKLSLVSPLGFNERAVLPVRDPDLPEPGKRAGIVRLAYAGTLQKGKGLENLFRALSFLPAHYQLTIVGGRPSARLERLMRLAEELRLGERLFFKGMVEQRQVGECLTDCDIFIIPQNTGEDFFAPIKMYEALGFALPIVASPISSLCCTLHEGKNALFAADASPQSLAAAIRRLGENPALRQAMRRNNLEASRAYQASARAKKLLEVFRQHFGT